MAVDARKRRQNERKFKGWEDLLEGGRRYWYDVVGRSGQRARYVKEVDAEENTLRFFQEIYAEDGELVEIHDKYPQDRGHKSVQED